MARNEVGISDPLEPEDPVKVVRPPGKPSCFSFSINILYVLTIFVNVSMM